MQTPPHTHLENVRLLHASRRLDWRFLLPDPTLDVIAYLGPPGGALVEALRLFSTSSDVLQSADALGARPSHYDLLVLVNPAPDTLGAACAAVKPGGHVYAEFRRLPVKTLATSLRSASALARHAETQGLTDVRTHWHWPTFDACTRIVPLDQVEAFTFTLTHGRDGRTADLKAAAARMLVKTGMLGWVAPCISVTGRMAGAR